MARNAVPILWWNNIVAAPGEKPVALSSTGGDSLRELCQYIEGIKPTPTAVRIVYGSQELDHSNATCPKASRAMIRKVLMANFTDLANAGSAWAVHKVHTPASGAPSTILYIEKSGALSTLRAMLAENGIRLEAVIPLLVALEAHPAIGNKPQPTVALLHSDNGAIVYWFTAAANRHARFINSDPSQSNFALELSTAFESLPQNGASNFLLFDVATSPYDVSQFPAAKKIELNQLLESALTIDIHGPSNLLPPETKLPIPLMLYAGAAVLAVAAIFFWQQYVTELSNSQDNKNAQEAEQTRLTHLNAHLTANKAQIEQIQAALNEALIAPQHKLRFLQALNRARPVPISIRSATLNETAWTVSGYIHEGVDLPNGPYPLFLKNLSQSDLWVINPETMSAVQKSSDFTINGTFK